MRQVFYVFSLLFMLLSTTALGGIVVEAATEKSTEPAGLLTSPPGIDPESVALRFQVRADGTTTAQVRYRIPLDDGNSTAAFEQFQRNLSHNRTVYTNRFARRATQTVATAEAYTGREMAATNVTVRAATQHLPQEYGFVVYTFEWTGFGETDQNRLIIGDAIAGLYVNNETELQISWPAHYEVQTIHSSVARRGNHTAVWTGPITFDQNGPRIVLVAENTWTDVSIPIVGIGILLLLGFGAGGLWWRHGTRPFRHPSHPTESTSTSETTMNATTPPSPGTEVKADGTDEAPATGDPPELLSNEERVLWALEQQGGRAKQQDVVELLGWSEAKASRIISDLRDKGDLDGFRLGNENVLSLPTEESNDTTK